MNSHLPYSLPALGKKAVHVSVPTTSGTGSETTSAAVFIDPNTKVKKLLLDNSIVPHYAILDADTTDSLPYSITVATGMDALTHAIESSVALNSTALSRALALEAATDILENLESSAREGELTPEKKEAREKLHIASALAGVAITNSCTGIAHSYDHPGPAFGLPHGTVCGLMLPYTMEFCGVQPAYVSLSKRLGYTGDDKQLTKALINHLFTLMDKLTMKSSLQKYGIDEAEYMSKIDEWATNSLNAFATVVSPSQMTFEKGRQLFKNCYYGKHSMY